MRIMLSKLSKPLLSFIILLFTAFCTVPFLLVLSSSFTAESAITRYGFNLIPRQFDTKAYAILFQDLSRIVTGYKISFIVMAVGTAASLLINSLLAYPIALKRVRYRKGLNVFTLITILFNGGMVPWYIVCVRYLGLQDNLWALILPYLCQAWNVFLLRSYFQSLPEEMTESAKIDGAGEYRIFFRIILPLSKPVLATVGLFIALMYWNDWWLGIMLINKSELQPLQMMLRTIQSNIQYLTSSPKAAEILQMSGGMLPSESLKMAVCIITIGPIVLLYPFVQRYFIKGIMIGAVKG
jgi:putative aldouronate transport system permease protein